MSRVLAIVTIYLSSLLLIISCSKQDAPKKIETAATAKQIVEFEKSCIQKLVTDLGYSEEQFTTNVMECNILKLQSQDAKIRRYKGQRRVEIVYLNVKCDEIARMLSQYEQDCKNSLSLAKNNDKM